MQSYCLQTRNGREASRSMCCILAIVEQCWEGITAYCKFHGIQTIIYGQACEYQEYRNISVTQRYQCTLACIQSRDCKAIIHDVRHSMCILFPQPCMLLRTRADHVYQSLFQPCTKWFPNGDDVPGYWIREGGATSYIVRRYIDDDLVVGKVTDKFHSVHPSGTDLVDGGDYENLVVDASCRVTWVSYDATSGQPMPTAALIGGFLEETNTHLYVRRLTICNNYVVGYYNPLNHKAWAELGTGIENGVMFDIMTVQPSATIPWAHSDIWLIHCEI